MDVSKVMIIDDDRTTSGLLKILLELDGFEVTLAPKGETALEEAKEIKPDAFVVDINLADALGTDVVRQLRSEEQFAKSAIVMTSGLPNFSTSPHNPYGIRINDRTMMQRPWIKSVQ